MVSITLCVTIMFNVLLFAANASSKTDTSESAILYEDEAKRNLYEKHFVCSDGTYLAVTRGN